MLGHPKRRPCRLQTAAVQTMQTVPTEYFSFLILVFAFTFDLHIFWLWSQIISVQLYFGVLVYVKATLRDANLVHVRDC